MKINRDIEPLFDYSSGIIKILVIIAVIIAFVLIYDKFLKKRVIKIIYKPNIPKLKKRYSQRLESLYYNVKIGKVDIKDAYTELSTVVREFIEKSTGINTLSFSKSDAKKLQMGDLELLMEEFYPSEFSQKERGEILKSIKRSMEVIRRWKER